jgi:ABC-type multidrug transport system fused ATPase/permease subunit
MKNHDFEARVKEHKDINNNLAVPLYRKFCKEYELNFHFADEKSIVDHDKLMSILHDEHSLHDEALSLFNFVNKSYHPFKNGLVSFVYTTPLDFDYDNLGLDEIAQEMENKDAAIKKLENQSLIYTYIAVISTLILTIVVSINITDSKTFSILTLPLMIIGFALVMFIPNAIYSRRKKVEQQKFDKKLSELKQELEHISIRYEGDNTKKELIKEAKND